MKGKGIVMSLTGNKAKIKVTSGSECMECPLGSQCYGGFTAGKTVGKSELTVMNEYGARVSDHVVFEVFPENAGKLILSAALIWILPLLLMIVGYIVVSRFGGGFWPIGGAFLFLGCSLGIILKRINTFFSGNFSAKGNKFYPRISKILDAPESS